MTRSREQIYMDYNEVHPDNAPILEVPRPKSTPHTTPLVTDLCVYWWAAKDDPLPFYVGISQIDELYQAICLVHKYPKGGYTIHQMYRDILKENFLAHIITTPLTFRQAQQYQHYLYMTFTSNQHSTNQDACFTQREPNVTPNYEVIKPIPTLPPSSPRECLVRHARKDELKKKLQKKQANIMYQNSIKPNTPS